MSGMLAKVINSTIGTPEFKPLDAILRDEVRLVGSDEILYVYDGDVEIVRDGEILETLQGVSFSHYGTVNLKIGNDSAYLKPSIYRKNTDGSTNNISFKRMETASTGEYVVAFNVIPEVYYYIELDDYKRTLDEDTALTFCATPRQASKVNIEVL